MKNKFKKLIGVILILVLCASFAVPAFAQQPSYAPLSLSREQRVEELRQIIDNYLPTINFMLEQLEQLFPFSYGVMHEDADTFIHHFSTRVDADTNVVSALTTISHYTTHAFQTRFIGGRHNHFINDEVISITLPQNIIRSSDAGIRLPESLLQTQQFRRLEPDLPWRTYIMDRGDSLGMRNNTSSNASGAIGMLIEMGAYYNDGRTLIALSDYLLEYFHRNGFSQELLSTYVVNFSTSVNFFYRFAYWTFDYLLNVRTNHPAEFEAIMNNAEYIRAFLYIHDSYARMVENDMPQAIDNFFSELYAMHNRGAISIPTTWMVSGGEMQEIPGNLNAFERLRTLSGAQGILGWTDPLSEFPHMSAVSVVLREEISAPEYREILAEMRRRYESHRLNPPAPPVDTTTMPEPSVITHNFVSSDWAAEDINRAILLNLVPQTLPSNYTQPATRAEFAALAVMMFETAVGGEIVARVTFNDTSDVNVEKAAGIGVVTGVGGGNFAPYDILTREQAAVMLARLARAVRQSPLPQQAATFADNAEISAWAIEGVGQIQAAGIMGGVGNNMFAPQEPYTREQSIITILRLFDLLR